MTMSLFPRSVAVAVLAPLLIPAMLYWVYLGSSAQPQYSTMEIWRHQLLRIAFMAAPQLLLIAFGLLFSAARRRAWLSKLILVFTLATVSFQAWEVAGAGIVLAYWWPPYYLLALGVAVVSVFGVLFHWSIDGEQTSGSA